MASPTPGSTPPERGVIPAEWPAQAADTIVEAVAKVRDKTTKPVLTAGRYLVYGLIAGVVGIVAAILVLVLIVRLWANYVPGHVWIIYAIFFVAFSAPGLIMLRKANAPASPAEG